MKYFLLLLLALPILGQAPSPILIRSPIPSEFVRDKLLEGSLIGEGQAHQPTVGFSPLPETNPLPHTPLKLTLESPLTSPTAQVRDKAVLRASPIKLSLESAVLIGASNSVLLKSLDSKKKISKMVVTEKWRDYLPKLGISYFGLRNLNQNQQDTLYNDVRITVQQLVYDADADLQYETAKITELLMHEDFREKLQILGLEIRKAYIKALAARGKEALAIKVLERGEEILRVARLESGQGLITPAQLQEAMAKKKQAEAVGSKIRMERKSAEYELKKAMNLDYNAKIELTENLHLDFAIYKPETKWEEWMNIAIGERADLKKAKIIIAKAKEEKHHADYYWIPKLYVGGYAGRNGQEFPLRHDAYGLNFSLILPLGSSSVSSNGNLGIQKDGTGIQRYPGFGNQFVGQGTNSYNSTDVKLFDNLSYARKIAEGRANLEEALLTKKALENKIALDIAKNADILEEKYSQLNLQASRLILEVENLKNILAKAKLGLAKKADIIGGELSLFSACEEYTDSISAYLTSVWELKYSVGSQEIPGFYETIEGGGNSVIARLLGGGLLDSGLKSNAQ